MKIRTGSVLSLAAGALFFLSVAQSAHASSSGLNNIPTTDTPPTKAVVLQTWFNLGENLSREMFVGFKTSPIENLEVGLDWRALSNTSHSHATLQAKYSIDIFPELLPHVWKAAVGIANLSADRDHNGEPFPFVAASVDLKCFRLHAGFSPQRYNEAFFFGIDKTVTVLDRNLQFRADAIQFNDMREMLYSAGFVYEFGRKSEYQRPEGILGVLDDIAKNIILEGWVSMPSDNGQETFTVKLNYVIRW
ncbi:MAG: hypothetical protein QGG42_10570 [Phycisphaerae bacterium]|jgi:hypothetical protein|nr:hypothetical protein [Phycisphaerae bacterium]